MEAFHKTLQAIESILAAQKKFACWTPYRLLSVDGIRDDAEICEIVENEICEMALPALLDGGSNFLAAAKRRAELTGRPEDIELINKKFKALGASAYLKRLRNLPAGFGFVSYPAYLLVDPAALVERFPGDAESYFETAYPLVYELEGAQLNGRPLPGWLAFYFVKPESMRRHVERVRQKTLEAVCALECLNTKIVSLGGLSASLTGGGLDLVGKTGKAAVTTGHNYTVANMLNTLKKAAKVRGALLEQSVIAIVGAAGSVGSGLAAICAADLDVKEIILIDEKPLEPILSGLRGASVPVRFGRILEDIPRADFILVATSSSRYLFGAESLKYGAVVIDDSQPKNVSAGLIAERPDILVLEGGAVAPPKGQYAIRRAFGPALKDFHWNRINNPLAGSAEVPCCLAEAWLWAMIDEPRERYSIGRPEIGLVRRLNLEARRLGFEPGVLQGFGKIYHV